MILSLRKATAFAAALAAIVLLGTATPARATLTLTLHETGFTDVTVSGSNAAVFAGAFGDFIISIDSGNSAGSTPSVAQLLTTTSSTRNSAFSAKTLTVTVTQTFSAPIGDPLLLNSSLSSTALARGGTLMFQSFLNATPTTVLTLTGPITPPATGGAGSPPVSVSGITSSYTLRNVTTVTLNGNSSANSTGTSTVTAAAPEPSSLAMAGIGLVGVFFYGRRRARSRRLVA